MPKKRRSNKPLSKAPRATPRQLMGEAIKNPNGAFRLDVQRRDIYALLRRGWAQAPSVDSAFWHITDAGRKAHAEGRN